MILCLGFVRVGKFYFLLFPSFLRQHPLVSGTIPPYNSVDVINELASNKRVNYMQLTNHSGEGGQQGHNTHIRCQADFVTKDQGQ